MKKAETPSASRERSKARSAEGDGEGDRVGKLHHHTQLLRTASTRRVARTLLPLCAVALLLFACTPPVGVSASPGNAVIYVIDRGWHTDIGLPTDEIAGPLATLGQRFPGVQFLTFGFGERQFLLSHQATLGEMLSALLPSQSALLMTALSASPEAAFGAQHVVTLHVPDDGIARIEAAIWQALEKTPSGTPMLLADGPYPGSVFYAARGTYDAFNTCNTWTAEQLHAGGFPASSAGVLFSGQVMGMARAIAAQQASMRHG